jgi:hypothetical protein
VLIFTGTEVQYYPLGSIKPTVEQELLGHLQAYELVKSENVPDLFIVCLESLENEENFGRLFLVSFETGEGIGLKKR